MSGRGRRSRRGRGSTSIRRLTQQVATLKSEMRTQDTGHFAKRLSCIRLPPHESTPKMFRKVRLQHIGDDPDFVTSLTSSVHNNLKPNYGYYNFISFTVYEHI